MTDAATSTRDRINSGTTLPKTPRNTKKSTTHDGADTVSKNAKKAQIADITSAITGKAIADADSFADELYSEAFLNRLSVKREGIEALSFVQLQGKAKQKTAHVLGGGEQLQIAGGVDSQPRMIFACEDWLGDDDE